MQTILSGEQHRIDGLHHAVDGEGASPPAQSKRRRRVPAALLLSSLILAAPSAASTANAAGFLENLLGSIQKGVNSLLENPGGVLSEIEGAVNTEGSNLGSLPIVGGLLGHLI